MAGFDPQLITGGNQGTLTSAPSQGSGVGSSHADAGAAVQPHHGLVVIVLAAVLVLLILDKAGFRFAVAVGKR